MKEHNRMPYDRISVRVEFFSFISIGTGEDGLLRNINDSNRKLKESLEIGGKKSIDGNQWKIMELMKKLIET